MSAFASTATLAAASHPSMSAAGSASATPARWAAATASATLAPRSISPSITLVVELSTPSMRSIVLPRRPWRAREKTGTPSITVAS